VDTHRYGVSLTAQRIRSGRRWQEVRSLHRQKHPLCCDPFKRHEGPEPMNHVHHILPVATHPHLAHDFGNLASLCESCHGEVEGLERRGQPTQDLFR
jgi:5-methylcytosine-specific restriction endonuclease McrA